MKVRNVGHFIPLSSHTNAFPLRGYVNASTHTYDRMLAVEEVSVQCLQFCLLVTVTLASDTAHLEMMKMKSELW